MFITQAFTRPVLRILGITALVAGILTGAPTPPAQADQNEQLGSVTQASISVGGDHTCAILGGGAVRCWGYNGFGQLGLGNTNDIGDNENPTVNVNLGGAATAISAGNTHTCALLTGGNVRCWGDNFYGQLGLGNTNNIGDNENPTVNVNLGGATATAITTGTNYTCALLTSGNVRCWGRNNQGQLGLGNTNNIGDNENPTIDVNLGGASVIAITAGHRHACVLFVGGNVRCWGLNTIGQLGLGNTNTIGDDEDPTTDVNLGTTGIFPFFYPQTATAVSAGTFHNCVVMSTGAVRCWGDNSNGQLGLGNTTVIGDNENPTTNVDFSNGDPLSLVTANTVTTGGAHSCARFVLGNIRCWGSNGNGQLGLGNTTVIGDNESPTTNVNLGGTSAGVSSGAGHTCAVLSGVILCWGFNLNGHLGIGATNNIGDNENPTSAVPYLVMGPDAQNPTVGITTPSPDQSFASSPVTISGNAIDYGGITNVQVAIYRSFAGGQFWNGTGWQAAYTTTTATLNNPNSTGPAWTYVFNAPPGGKYSVAAFAFDPSGNYGIAPYTNFSITDTTNPAIALLTPTTNQTFTSKPITITGIATDDASIYDVQIAIYRGLIPTGQFWNGTTWQTGYTTIPTTLTAPGTNATGYTYTFNPPQNGGTYYVAAVALDTTYNYTYTPWTPFTLPDTVAPNATVTTPTNNSVTNGTFTIAGTATDNNAVYSTNIAIYQASTGKFWNGTTFQTGFTSVPATMSAPGTTNSAYTYFFTPPTPGYYLIAALPIDTNYNYTLTTFNTINAT
jgi:alpha-tubulin suppressor-like RCC1 family protein